MAPNLPLSSRSRRQSIFPDIWFDSFICAWDIFRFLAQYGKVRHHPFHSDDPRDRQRDEHSL